MTENKENSKMTITNARINHTVIDRFSAEPGQAWCILGNIRSGADDFFDLVSGEGADARADTLILPENSGTVSFDQLQAIFEAELKKDNTDFMDKIDPGTPARQFLKNPEKHKELIRAFGLQNILNKGFRQLSTGQVRKLIILSRITRNVSCLILQSPYDGLDTLACKELNRALAQLLENGFTVLLFLNNPRDMPAWCTHVGIMSGGRLVYQGEKQGLAASLVTSLDDSAPDFKASVKEVFGRAETGAALESTGHHPLELIRLNRGFAGYEGQVVFKDLNLIIRRGEHTLVTGPNGCGKSTLLQVIIGDHPACYQNDLRIFGIQRGTGESIWDIKRHMGIVSPDLHRNYRVPGSVLHCILSGLFDSIGLYRTYTPEDEKRARTWLDRLGMADQAATPFRQLGFARQRLILIARALIKAPRLLILDEPTQGLDQANREAILNFLEKVALMNLSTILYVSHRQDEFRGFFSNRLKMGV